VGAVQSRLHKLIAYETNNNNALTNKVYNLNALDF
jgi:hypothetical protein